MAFEPVSAHLPHECKWLEAKVLAASPHVVASARISADSVLELRFNLLRRNEFVRFQALAHAPEGDRQLSAEGVIVKGLTFAHRIANTAPIRQLQSSLTKPSKKEFVLPVLLGLFSLVAATAFVHVAVRGDPFLYVLHLQTEGGQLIEVRTRGSAASVREGADGNLESVAKISRPWIEPGSPLVAEQLLNALYALIFVACVPVWAAVLKSLWRRWRIAQILSRSAGDPF